MSSNLTRDSIINSENAFVGSGLKKSNVLFY
jgi:hypothetical protein